jgi:hypothetical protein
MNEHTRAMQKQYRIDHKEDIAEKKRAYYLKNKEHIREYQNARMAASDATEKKEKDRAYYLEHKDATNARARAKRLPGLLHRSMLKEFRSKYAPWNEGNQPGIYQIDFEESEIASCWLDAKRMA